MHVTRKRDGRVVMDVAPGEVGLLSGGLRTLAKRPVLEPERKAAISDLRAGLLGARVLALPAAFSRNSREDGYTHRVILAPAEVPTAVAGFAEAHQAHLAEAAAINRAGGNPHTEAFKAMVALWAVAALSPNAVQDPR